MLATGPLLPIAGAVTADSTSSRMGGPPGIAIVTRIAQIVSAPVSGRVAYAAPFRELGPLLIIDRGGGYHVVLVGVTRLDVREGARVVAGQSLGEIDARWNGPASLHVELRHRGVPIDPAAWFGAHQDKVAS